MAATIIDVALRCGYSKATVSRAFADPHVVSEKARTKIYAAARELNYTPNAIARAMVLQKTENIAFIINEKQYPAVLNPFYSPILEAVMQACSDRNYSVFVTTDNNIHLPNGDTFIRKHMDGVIFAGETNIETVEAFRSQHIPVILLNNCLELDNLVCMTVDHYNGAVAAVNHLFDRGHRKVGLLAGRFSRQVSEARLKGYLDVLQTKGLTPDAAYMRDIEPTPDEAGRVITELLSQPDCPTAFFCTNDAIAAGAVKAALRAGYRVPEDIAVVGFDDSYISRVIEPELTTVRVDTAAMGREAARRLFDMIDGTPVEETDITIPVSLVVRGST